MIIVIPYYNFENNPALLANHNAGIAVANSAGYDCLTVEILLRDQQPSVHPTASNIVLHRRTRSAVWQKEAAVNLAYRHLDSLDDFDGKMMWIDSGCYLDPAMYAATDAKLDTVDVVQCFSVVRYLRPDKSVELTRMGHIYSKLFNGPVEGAPGGALAAKGQLFEEGGLYPYMIVGGGDSVFMHMVTGTDKYTALRNMPPALFAHMNAWCERMRKHGWLYDYVPGPLYHLWHIVPVNRQERARHTLLRTGGFVPVVDADLCNGVIEWNHTRNPVKLAMHSAIQKYMQRRGSGTGPRIAAASVPRAPVRMRVKPPALSFRMLRNDQYLIERFNEYRA